MPRVWLKVNGVAAEDRLADISTDFPDTEFKILAVQPRDDSLLEIIEVTTPRRNEFICQFENESNIRLHEVLHTNRQVMVIQFYMPMSESYNAVLESKMLPEYPISLRDGWFTAGLSASREQLSAYTEGLEAADVPCQILSVTPSYDPSELLTDRQWEFIAKAVEQGYYDSPRGCTLTDLAEMFSVNSSAASGVVHRAEERIVKQFVTRARARS
jgi:predicted DNA binding protein